MNVLVTGASSGIGLALSKQFAGRAQKLVLIARREGKLRELKKELESTNSGLEVIVEVVSKIQFLLIKILPAPLERFSLRMIACYVRPR